MEDRRLLMAYRQGEEGALGAIYAHYQGSVAGLLRSGFSFSSGGQALRFRGYGSPFELQDALQETFLKAFGEGARQGYSGLTPFGPYLLGIARNLVIDEFRRRRREMALFVPESAEVRISQAEALGQEVTTGQWAGQWANPERLAIERQQSALVIDFLADLDEGQRQLVALRFVEGLSQEETADRMGVDRNRVRRMVKELRVKLLRFMKGRGHISALDASELLGLLALGVTW